MHRHLKMNIIKLILLSFTLMNPALCFTQPAGHMSVLFAGDLMQHSPQLKAAIQSDGAYAYDTCFSYISDHFHRAHLVIINMETTFAGAPYSGYPLFCSPNELAIAARDAGINVFLTANNHILDRGPRGVKRSVALYDSIGVDHCGTSNKWLLLEHNGIRLGLLNYTYGTNGHRIPKDICLNILDTTAIACDIREVQQAGADFIVCCLHWGVEYSMKPGAEQKRLALWLKNQGTGAVIGSHPHVPQGVDITYDHNGNIEFLTAYSLGNFISNQPGPMSRAGMLLGFDLVRKNGRVQIVQPFHEWVWTWRPAGKTGKRYHVLPVSDPRLYRNLIKNQQEVSLIAATIDSLRNFMKKNAPDCKERKRYPLNERENLYFGDHPSFCPVWTQQPVSSTYHKSFPPIKDRCTGRADKSPGAAGAYSPL